MSRDINVCRQVRISPFRRGMGPVFTLTMWDDAGYDHLGKQLIRYTLVGVLKSAVPGGGHHVKQVFAKGADFACSPLHCTDSDETVAALMSFLALPEYVGDYSEALALECERRFSREAA